MSAQSRATEEALKGLESIKIGGFDVTPDWIGIGNPLMGHGSTADQLVFNPNDPTQRLLFSKEEYDASQLGEYFRLNPSSGGVDDPFSLLGYNASQFDRLNLDRGAVSSLFSAPTVSQLAEQQRIAETMAKVQSGQLAQHQANQILNDPNEKPTGLPDPIVGDVPKQTSPASGTGVVDRTRARSSAQAGGQSTYNVNGVQYDTATGSRVGSSNLEDEAAKARIQAQIDLATQVIGQLKGGGTVSPELLAQLQPYAKGVNQTQQLQAANNAGGSFSLDALGLGNITGSPSGNLSTSQLGDAPSVQDIQNALAPFRQTIADTIQKSQVEKEIEGQLATLRNSAELSLLGLENQPIPQGFIVGQSREQAKLYQAQEANLLARLGLAQDDRELRAELAQKGYEFALQDTNIQLEAAQRIEDQNDKIFERAMALSSQAKDSLASILELGLDPNNLDPAAQQAIMNIAQSIPEFNSPGGMSLITEAMQVAYDETQYNRLRTGVSSGKSNSLTITEAATRGLPLTLAGNSEESVIKDLSSAQVPEWFLTDVLGLGPAEAQLLISGNNLPGIGGSILRQTSLSDINAQWQEFRRNVIMQAKEEDAFAAPTF